MHKPVYMPICTSQQSPNTQNNRTDSFLQQQHQQQPQLTTHRTTTTMGKHEEESSDEDDNGMRGVTSIMLRIGLKYGGYKNCQINRAEKATNIKRFISLYGSSPCVVALIWEDLQTTQAAAAYVFPGDRKCQVLFAGASPSQAVSN